MHLTLACDTMRSIASSSILSAMMVGIVDAASSTSEDKRLLSSASFVSDLQYNGAVVYIGRVHVVAGSSTVGVSTVGIGF